MIALNFEKLFDQNCFYPRAWIFTSRDMMDKLLHVKISMPQCGMQIMPILLTSYYGVYDYFTSFEFSSMQNL